MPNASRPLDLWQKAIQDTKGRTSLKELISSKYDVGVTFGLKQKRLGLAGICRYRTNLDSWIAPRMSIFAADDSLCVVHFMFLSQHVANF